MGCFMMHHKHKGLSRVLYLSHPLDTFISNDFSYISVFFVSAFLSDKIRVIIITLSWQDIPMVKSGRIRFEMPFANHSSCVTGFLEKFRKCLLRAIKWSLTFISGKSIE